jgi:hypothetical protein
MNHWRDTWRMYQSMEPAHKDEFEARLRMENRWRNRIGTAANLAVLEAFAECKRKRLAAGKLTPSETRILQRKAVASTMRG